MTQEATRRLAAVWLADIVGLSQLSPQDEKVAQRVVREFKRLAATQCEAHGGRRPRTMGDALVAVFDNADGALQAALAFRDAFLSDAEVRAQSLSIRVGVHVGDVTEAPNGDTYGDAVNTVARVKPVAEPGQVLLTDIAYRLLQQRSTIEVEDLGEHALKGVPEPVRLYAARLVAAAETADLKDLLQHELAPLQILDVEGFGGMGEIYLARDPGLRRTLAVKVLRSEFVADAQARARFQREAQVIAGLSHPNVVGVHSVGELKDGTPYFVMDYVEGGSLADRLERDGPLTVNETRRIVGEVASALAAAHAKGVVHRDIKPSNILFDTDSGRSMVTDWGIAALDPTVELSPETRLTQAGVVIGSPQYMSPEQLAGDEVGPESDIYSLGLLAFELLTGHGPFEADTPRALMVAHLREDPPKLSDVREDVDPEFESVIARCLGKNPRDRATADELAGRFAPGAEAVLEWPPPGTQPLIGRTFAFLLNWLGVSTAVAGPILLAFAARIQWKGQGPIRDLLHGRSGVVVVIILVVGISLFMVAALLASQRSTAKGIVIERRKGKWYNEHRDPIVAALALGYGWRTLAEVTLDRWGDHGNVLSGQREYAVLNAEERAVVRRRFLRKGVLLLAAFLLLPFSLLSAAYAVSSGSLSPGVSLGVFVSVPTLLWIMAMALPTDPQAVIRARMALSGGVTAPKVLASEVDAWRAAAKKVTQGLGPKEGRATSKRMYWTLQGFYLVILILPYAYVMAALISMALGGLGFEASTRNVGARFQRVSSAEHVRLMPDGDMTPEAAREMVDAIMSWDLELTPWRGPIPDAADLRGSSIVDTLTNVPFGLAARRVIPAALLGLSEPETEYLRRFTGDPRFEWFDRLARAGGYDPGDPERYPPDMIFGDHASRPPMNVSLVAGHKVAQTGFLISVGRVEEAEEALRSVYSVGYLLARESNDLLEATVGRNIATLALDGLLQFYTRFGRNDEATRLALDAAPPMEDRVIPRWQDWLQDATATVADTTEVRSVRLAIMHDLLVAFECTNLEGLLLGLPPDIVDRVAEARESLVRFPSDEAFVSMAATSGERLHRLVRDASPEGLREILDTDDLLPYRALRLSGKLLGNPRFFTCPAFIGR